MRLLRQLRAIVNGISFRRDDRKWGEFHDRVTVYAYDERGGKRLRSIELLKSQGMSNRAVAHRLGVSEKAIRKLVGPSEPTARAQLALPEITASVGKPVEMGVPPATPTS